MLSNVWGCVKVGFQVSAPTERKMHPGIVSPTLSTTDCARPPWLRKVLRPQVLVNEPSVSDTINILRGLSERYSSYHGVRIADRALVVAAELSDRYITARFLPDKAIDLVDEACAALRVQLDSVPEDIDALQRRITALQV